MAAWIKEHYPSLQYKESTLVTSLSSIRKQLRGDSNIPTGPQPTLQDLLRVQTITENGKGVHRRAFLKMIEKVDTAATKVGGFDRLKQCLRTLKKIKG